MNTIQSLLTTANCIEHTSTIYLVKTEIINFFATKNC